MRAGRQRGGPAPFGKAAGEAVGIREGPEGVLGIVPKCPEVVALLLDYLEERLPPQTRAELERHLGGCRSCESYLASYRSTVDLLHSITESDLPPELHMRLRAFLDRRCGGN